MNKDKYLKELEKRLECLTPEQKQEEIFRISNELDTGNVINDLNVEINEIYKKYKIDINKKQKNSDNNLINKVNEFSKRLNIFVKNIKKKKINEKFIIIRDIVILMLLISILKIPFIAIETILYSIFGEIFSYDIFNIINFIIEIAYIVFAVLTFIRLFKKRFKVELEIEND